MENIYPAFVPCKNHKAGGAVLIHRRKTSHVVFKLQEERAAAL